MKNFNIYLTLAIFFSLSSAFLYKLAINNTDSLWPMGNFLFSAISLIIVTYLICLTQDQISGVLNNKDSDATKIEPLVDFIASRYLDLGTKLALASNFYYYDQNIKSYIILCDKLFSKYEKLHSKTKSKDKSEKIEKEYNQVTDRLKLQWSTSKNENLEVIIKEKINEIISNRRVTPGVVCGVIANLTKYFDHKLLAQNLRIYLNGEYHNIPDSKIVEFIAEIFANNANKTGCSLTDRGVSLCLTELYDLCKTE